jgi:hypothetical protein
MNSLKCPECGMVNFTSAPACRRCKLEFSEALVSEAEALKTDAVAYQFWPPRTVDAEKPEPDWQALSDRLRSGGEEPVIEEAAAHTTWTVIFAICLILASVVFLFLFHQYLQPGEGEWRALTNTQSRLYVPVYEKLYWFEALFRSCAFVMQLILLLTFFAKSRRFLQVVSIYLIAQFFFVLVEVWGWSVFAETIRQKQLGPSVDVALDTVNAVIRILFISAILIAVWFVYFRASKRVKKIFIY